MTTMRTTVCKLLGWSPVAKTGLDVNTTQGLTLAGPGLALRGYDPVAYFTEGQPVIGKATYTATYNQDAYQFATEANLQAFKAHPERFVAIWRLLRLRGLRGRKIRRRPAAVEDCGRQAVPQPQSRHSGAVGKRDPGPYRQSGQALAGDQGYDTSRTRLNLPVCVHPTPPADAGRGPQDEETLRD
jgi:YHS domain-containing protein